MLSVAVMTLPGLALADVIRESSEKTVEGAGINAVRIENARGAVNVRPSSDGRIHLIALKEVRSFSSSDRARLRDQTQVSTTQEGGTFVVHVTYPNSVSVHLDLWDMFNGAELPRFEVKLTLEVPAKLPLTVTTSSGDISTTALAGAQVLTASSGDMEIRDAAGPVSIGTSSGDVTASGLAAARVRCASGDIHVDLARGPLDLHTQSGGVTVGTVDDSLAVSTVSGDVEVTEAKRGLRVTTASGGVEVNGASGNVRIETSSGDIRASLRSPLSAVEIGAASGDLQIRFDHDASLRLDVRTTSGTVDAGLPLRVLNATRHSLSAISGSGRTPVTLRSSSGDIHVTNGGR
jgi:DUF4097 and DUF4098 domain-containing protein YvlB